MTRSAFARAFRRFAAAALGCCVATLAPAAALEVMSAGAVEPGLVPLIRGFERGSGHTVRVTFSTATVLSIAPSPDAARALIAYLTTASAKARFAAAGIE